MLTWTLLLTALSASRLASAFTLPDQLALLQEAKRQLVALGGNWSSHLNANWICPTPPATSNSSCDPCGARQWWGNWAFIGCRGDSLKQEDILGGDGHVTNIHFTDINIEGPSMDPVVNATCPFGEHVKEYDIAGSDPINPLTGTLPARIASCFPNVNAMKFSFNNFTSTLPPAFSNLTRLQYIKVRQNLMTGSIPASYATPTMYFLDLANNHFSGSIPDSFATSRVFAALTMGNNEFSGPLYNLRSTSMVLLETSNNTGLCGMVPATARWASGYNPYGTDLGKPCPGEKYPPSF